MAGISAATLLFAAAAHASTLVSYSANGTANTSPASTYSVSFTAALSTPTGTSPDGSEVFYRDSTNGLETSLSVLLDGVEIFNEATAGVSFVSIGIDGSFIGFRLGGNVRGITTFSAFEPPDMFGDDFLGGFQATYQPTDGLDNQINFIRTTDITVTVTDISAVPLPAGSLLLLSALGAGALLRRRKGA